MRGADGLVLTPRAEALARAARSALVQLEHTLRAGADFRAAISSRQFRIATADAFDILILPALLERLQKSAPHIDLAVIRPRNQDIAAMLETGEVDLYFGVLPNQPLFAGLLPDPGARSLETAKVYDEGWTCLVRRGHPRLRRSPTVSQYVREGHILFSPTGEGPGIIDRLLEGQGLSRRIALRVTSFHAAYDCATRTDFIWTGPSRIAAALDPGKTSHHFQPPFELPTYPTRIVWHQRFSADPAHRWFRDQVIAAAKSSK